MIKVFWDVCEKMTGGDSSRLRSKYNPKQFNVNSSAMRVFTVFFRSLREADFPSQLILTHSLKECPREEKSKCVTHHFFWGFYSCDDPLLRGIAHLLKRLHLTLLRTAVRSCTSSETQAEAPPLFRQDATEKRISSSSVKVFRCAWAAGAQISFGIDEVDLI